MSKKWRSCMLTVWDDEQGVSNIVGNNDGMTRIVDCLVRVDADITLSTLSSYLIGTCFPVCWSHSWVLQ